ncbi:CoA transferase [Mycolicibacterium helvum]|uniref:CoA transferase n=2 Tax=Mycolicibacterium helvum TaxID=1534349 RepID=A0A7I7T953_9MYCO|nr:CoA transferase [Mycolicibacterium helvum]
MILGDLGARVIKIETPECGDDSRGFGPPFVGAPEDRQSTYFMSVNRNKESVELDLKSDAGAQALRELIVRADVLIENFRPGALDRLGFSPTVLNDLNPRLVILSISGFGHDGPEGGRPGYDQIAQGETGLMAVTGDSPEHPTRIGVAVTDVLAGVHGAVGALAALFDRQRGADGSVVRTSLLAAGVSAHTFVGSKWTVAGEVAVPTGNHHPSIAPYGSFACRDGHVLIACGSEPIWRRLQPLVDGADDDRFDNNAARVAHRNELTALIKQAFSTKSRKEVVAALAAAGVPAGVIRTIDEVYTWEQTRSQGLVIEVQDPHAGRVELPGPAVRIETADGHSLLRRNHSAPPTLGQHNTAIAHWLSRAAATSTDQEPQPPCGDLTGLGSTPLVVTNRSV